MIIDLTYFYGALTIPQVASDQATGDAVNFFIKEYEPKLLKALLGHALYSNLIAGLTADTQIYKDIRDGVEYTNRSQVLSKWDGLRFVDGTVKTSLIANYVYYWYMRNNASTTTPSGERVITTENSMSTSPRYKMSTAWNKMVGEIYNLREFLLSKVVTYPDFVDPFQNFSGDVLYNINRFLGRLTPSQELFVKMNPYL